MNEEDYYMSAKEIARRDVIKRCLEEKLPRATAAEMLNVSVRHVKRLLSAYRQHRDKALISKRRDQPSNNKIADEIKDLAIELISGEQYKNYGPTLAHEHLFEYHAEAFERRFSIETLRQWMIDAGLHDRKQRRAVKTHQSRPRQAGFGMLIQIDGSPHPWFEKRGAPCTLIAFVDDATSAITALHFCAAETTADYMQTLKQHLQRYGCPMALYSDRHSIFSNNAKEQHTCQQPTQFERALQQLGIKLCKAKSPQAKGRVERAFRILQDRLVKAMRLHDICTIEQANQFAEQYRQKYNQRFAKQPLDSSDYHRPVLHNERQLALVLSQQCERKLSKNLICQHHNIQYLIQTQQPSYALRGARVTVCELLDGEIVILYKGRELPYTTYCQHPPLSQPHDEKTINQAVAELLAKPRTGHKPKPDHPWRRYHTEYLSAKQE